MSSRNRAVYQDPGAGEFKYTAKGYTACWGKVIPHIEYRGMVLTPRIEREQDHNGRWKPKQILGLPIAERTPDGRFIYALPGGGGYVYG